MTNASSQGRHQRRRDKRRWRAHPERLHHRRRAGESADDHDERQGREIRPPREQPDRGAQPIGPEVGAGNRREHADVVMRAGAHAVEAERAVHVAGFLRQVQVELASALPRRCRAGNRGSRRWRRHAGSFSRTSNGETSELTKWNCPIGQTYLQKLAPRNSASIDEGGGEVGDHDPGRPAAGCPTARTPRRPRRTAPAGRRPATSIAAARGQWRVAQPEAASQLARQHERARHAEHVADREQPDDDEEAPVGPGQHAGEIHRRHLVAQEPVGDDGDGQRPGARPAGRAGRVRARRNAPTSGMAQKIESRARPRLDAASASARSSGRSSGGRGEQADRRRRSRG